MKLIILSFCCYRTIAHRAKIDQNVSLHYSRYEKKMIRKSFGNLLMNFGLLCNARRQHSAEALTNCQLGAFVFKLALFLIMHPHLHRKYVTEHKFFHVCGKEPQPGHIRDLISNYYTAVILLRAKIWEKRRSQHPTGEPEHQVMTPSLKKSLDC